MSCDLTSNSGLSFWQCYISKWTSPSVRHKAIRKLTTALTLVHEMTKTNSLFIPNCFHNLLKVCFVNGCHSHYVVWIMITLITTYDEVHTLVDQCRCIHMSFSNGLMVTSRIPSCFGITSNRNIVLCGLLSS